MFEFPAVARGTADEVFEVLFEGISTGQLRARDRLPTEEQLAGQFGVAIMTLRTALAQLRELGLVKTHRGRKGGSYIAADVADKLELASRQVPISVDDLRELLDWRRAISGEASSLAALRRGPEQCEELLRAAQEYRDAVTDNVERRFADARLHILIAKMSQSARLLSAEQELQEQLTRFMRTHADVGVIGAEALINGHDDLVTAILDRDPTMARSALVEHVEMTYEWAIRLPFVAGHLDEPFALPMLTR